MKIINESPDSFRINGKLVSYTRSDAISFIAFDGGFFVYSSAGVEDDAVGDYGHVALAEAWRLKGIVERMGESSLDEKSLEDWKFYKERIKTYGSPTPESENLLKRFLRDRSEIWDYPAYSKMLKGRLWIGKGLNKEQKKDSKDNNKLEPWEDEDNYPEPNNDKVISFWNRPSEVDAMHNLAIKMVELAGQNPKEYTYEVGNNNFLSYYEFLDIPEDKTDYNKEYNVSGSILKYSDFEDLRTTMHNGGPIKGKKAKERLCRILTPNFIEKNPELRGFIPADCSGIDISYQDRKLSGWRDDVRGEVEKSLAPSKQQTKGFMQGKRTEPVIRTTLGPGQAVGMTGRTMGGFRARTQKEINAAWDDFMRTREHNSPEKISFKEWFYFLENN